MSIFKIRRECSIRNVTVIKSLRRMDTSRAMGAGVAAASATEPVGWVAVGAPEADEL